MTAGRLVERDTQRRVLIESAQDVLDGRSRLLLLTGEAGIGKTSVWMRFVDELDEGWTTEFVGGNHTDRSFDAPFQQLAGPLPGDGEAARELAAAVADACRSRTSDAAMVLVVEDLHFVDPVAVAALPHLLDALAHEPVLIIATYRLGTHATGTPHSRAVADLLRHARAQEVRLEPLTPEGVRTMLEIQLQLEGRTAFDLTDNAARLHARTGGNPFFVDAVVRAGDADATEVPWTVAETVLAVVETLPANSRLLAELVATAGRPIAFAVVAQAVADWEEPAARLEESGLGTPIEPSAGLGLRHALVADALLATLSVSELASRHLTLAAAFEAAGPPDAAGVEALARHWAAGGAPDRASGWALQAADRLVGLGSHVRATELYGVAMANVPEDATERAGFFERAATAAAGAGQADLARSWGEQGREARIADGTSWKAVGSWVNTVLMRLMDDAGEGAAEGEVPAHPVTEVDPQAEALVVRAQEAVDLGDFIAARRLGAEADARAASVDDHASRANAALVFLYAGDIGRCDEVLDEVARHARDRRDWATVSVARSRSCRSAMTAGCVGEAVERNAMGLDAGKRAGGPDFWAHLALASAFLEAMAGEVRAADARCEEVLQHDLPMVVEIAKAVRANISMEQGDLALAEELLESLVPIVRALNIAYFAFPALWLLARLQVLKGQPAAAMRTITELENYQWSPFHEFAADLLLTKAVACHLLDDGVGVADVLRLLDELSETVSGPNVTGIRSFVMALSCPTDRSSLAADLFEQAAVDWERAPRVSLAADAYCEAAIRVASTDRERALRLARLATKLTKGSGLARVQWRAAIVEGMCAPPSPDLGVHRDEAVVRARRRALQLLTPRERDIVELVATGHSNKMIAVKLSLSEKTVRNYLSVVFTKLELTRRTEIAPFLSGS